MFLESYSATTELQRKELNDHQLNIVEIRPISLFLSLQLSSFFRSAVARDYLISCFQIAFVHPEIFQKKAKIEGWVAGRHQWFYICLQYFTAHYYQYTRPNRKSASLKHTLSGPQKTDSGLLMHYQPHS